MTSVWSVPSIPFHWYAFWIDQFLSFSTRTPAKQAFSMCIQWDISAFFSCAYFIHTQGNRSAFVEFYSSPVEYKISSSPYPGWGDWGSGRVCSKPFLSKWLWPAQNLAPEGFHFSWKKKKPNNFSLHLHYRNMCSSWVLSKDAEWHVGKQHKFSSHPSSFQAWFPSRALPLSHLFSMFSVRCVHLCLFLVLAFYLHKENLTLHVALVLTFST